MDYELKLEKSPRSPRFHRDRLTAVSKKSKQGKDVRINQSLIPPMVLFPKKDKVTFFDPSLIKSSIYSPFLTSPLIKSQTRRRVPNHPIKAIPINDPLDDYNFCPIDWSAKDIIALALDTKTVLINPRTYTKQKFHCSSADAVSLKFNSSGSILALGSLLGPVRLFDVDTEKPITTFQNVDSVVYSIDTSENIFISAHEAGFVCISDFRAKQSSNNNSIQKCVGNQCSRAVFSPDGKKIAVSHQNTLVSIFDIRNLEQPISINKDHTSVIHPISWSPKTPDLIATGGGLTDRTIKIWNTQNGKIDKQVDVASQICNLFWSKNNNEIISTQGFNSNNIFFWNETDLKNTAQIKGHKNRVLYAAISPDHNTLATLTENDPLQFWDLRTNIKSVPNTLR
ncbi:Meiotic fizzy-related protein 1 [Tritrichomonas foetus]|uniref:Meiotic fizzy-related protein 1 n=1 Tax=Tritrichomonas foetus TaxID=1144522 RepID=A0A1J4K704_9EUKA|nr:Meiotic fizzy-related protein 1 [Tritrichomonas foetus]|eukprot:OHT06971.1 Meiotic fizzy-related protein 1 [Tritrichomonas foetus]